MRELFSHASGASQKPEDGVRCPQSDKYTATQTLKSAGSNLIAHLLEADYGHSATALLGIAVLGILLAFPTLMF
jgi:hypothetical protein